MLCGYRSILGEIEVEVLYTGSYGDLGNLIKSHMNNLTSYPLSTSPLAMMASVLPSRYLHFKCTDWLQRGGGGEAAAELLGLIVQNCPGGGPETTGHWSGRGDTWWSHTGTLYG